MHRFSLNKKSSRTAALALLLALSAAQASATTSAIKTSGPAWSAPAWA